MKHHRDLLLFLLMLILVPLAGEPKFHPFGGEFNSFRVSLGSPIFLLFLLWIRKIPLPAAGLATGISVVIFRGFLDTFDGSTLLTGIQGHLPTGFYYFSYALIFALPHFDKKRLYNKSLQIAGWSILAEIAASIMELSTMQLLLKGSLSMPTPAMLLHLSGIAILRCFFILSFFFLTQLYTAETRIRQENHEKRRLMMLIAGLYEEVVQLDKSLKNAENITHSCYQIYEKLQKSANTPEKEQLAREMLAIVGQVHDIKKDNQRIYAGLSALTNNRRVDDYSDAGRLAELVIDAHRKYAISLKKTIVFTFQAATTLPRLHTYTLLSLINNLTANAVEAIEQQGTIDLALLHEGDFLLIPVNNTGSAIPPKRLQHIFEPGYTTKFDSRGNASTGVGLPYVRHLTDMLGGSIEITSDGTNQVACRLLLPLAKLKG